MQKINLKEKNIQAIHQHIVFTSCWSLMSLKSNRGLIKVLTPPHGCSLTCIYRSDQGSTRGTSQRWHRYRERAYQLFSLSIFFRGQSRHCSIIRYSLKASYNDAALNTPEHALCHRTYNSILTGPKILCECTVNESRYLHFQGLQKALICWR